MLKLGKASKETRGRPMPQSKLGFQGETEGSQLRRYV